MHKFVIAALAAAVFAAGIAPVNAEGAGTCGKGKKWNPDTQKCEKKPRGSQSGSHA